MYSITFNTSASEPVRVREVATGTYGRVTAPARHIGKVVLKLDADQVLCLNDTSVWTKFGNVFIEPLMFGESIVVQPDLEFGDDEIDDLLLAAW
jgi:hypothetical protein